MKSKNELLNLACKFFALDVILSALLWFLNSGIVIGALATIGVGIIWQLRSAVKGEGFNIWCFWPVLIGALAASVCLCLIKWPLW